MIVVDPVRKYMIQGQVYQLLAAPCEFAIGNNNLIVTGVTGYIVGIMGYLCNSAAATRAAFTLKNGSGGAALSCALFAPNYDLPPFYLPVGDHIYWRTTSGTGLYADVGTNILEITVFYLLYKA